MGVHGGGSVVYSSCLKVVIEDLSYNFDFDFDFDFYFD